MADSARSPGPAIDLNRSAHAHAAALRAGEYSARSLAEATLARVEAQERDLNAYIRVTPDEALAQADAADERLRAGDLAPLTGIPVGVKDVLSTRGVETTAGSRILEGFTPIIDCTVVARLREQGAVFVGKTNLDEFAMGSSTEHSGYGATSNPWDLTRVPGGSSGGSAATVAARGVPIALGTDTGGSIRQPAALTGIVGLKPTYGRVSRYGVVAFASSLEQVGPFARDARDAATLLQAIAGHDPNDATTAPEPVPDYTERFERGLEGLRVGVPGEGLVAGLEDGVREAFEQAVTLFEREGAVVDRSVALPSLEVALSAYYIIAPAEASANLARYDGVKYGYRFRGGEGMWDEMERTRGNGFGDEVKRRIMIGAYALSAGYYDAYYRKAQQVRTLVRAEFETALAGNDLLLTPTTPTVAFPLGAKLDDPLAMYLNDLLTIPVNISGNPAISIPGGFSEGLPVGIQLIARPLRGVDAARRRARLRGADRLGRAAPAARGDRSALVTSDGHSGFTAGGERRPPGAPRAALGDGRRSAGVRHPPLLRAAGQGAGRDLAGRRPAGLRDTRADHQRRRRGDARRPHRLHQQLRPARAARDAEQPARAPLWRPLQPGQRADADHRRLRGAGHRDARPRRPRRRGADAGALLRRLPAGGADGRRALRPRADLSRGRLHGHRRGDRGADYARYQGDPARLPLEPQRARCSTARRWRRSPPSPRRTTCS